MNQPVSEQTMKRNAFTLIELLIVVAIISLLISILLPAMGHVRAQARKSVCAGRLYQVAVGMTSYSNDYNGRLPCVETPMTNTAFGNPARPDAEVDPFDRQRWPISLPNLLMPRYIANEDRLFVCPSATGGWPRASKPWRFTYRDSGWNQPNGTVEPEESYLRAAFGVLDGRAHQTFRMNVVAQPRTAREFTQYAQEYVKSRATYMRDLVTIDQQRVVGPHQKGINVINRNFQVEFRSFKQANEDLAPSGAPSVQF